MMKRFITAFAFLSLAFFISAVNSYASDFISGRAGFKIRFGELETDLFLMATSIMPHESIEISGADFARTDNGELVKSEAGWLWTSPHTPGVSNLIFMKNSETITLRVFTLTPFENGKQKALNGYKIGTYNFSKFRGLDKYAAPEGFIAFDASVSDLKISPHFTLGQFICKQQPGYKSKYLLIQSETLIKLEGLLEAANASGWKADSFHIMSGYRTPFYNASIGNKTTSSRHLYGGGADIWLDGDGDGKMDDLNKDGVVNKDDARTLAKLAEELAKKDTRNWPAGGVGVYGSNAAHGPFVHIDARGYKARWG